MRALRRDHHRDRRRRRNARPQAGALAARRSCCSSAAGTSRASRRTGSAARCSARSATSTTSSGTTRTAIRTSPTSSTSSAATPSSTARSCSACASATSARCEHYGGISPAWPISYDDLEPYYAEAEKLYLVHSQAGEDPTEPWRSGPFPYPAVSHEPRIQQLSDDFERTGHHPFHLPVGIDLNESDPEAGRCVRCDRFDGFPCLTDGKADAHVRCVRPALAAHNNLKLITHAKVERLETDPGGRSVTASMSTAAARPRPTAPTSWWSHAGRPTRRRCC